jgi:hypothetical protein
MTIEMKPSEILFCAKFLVPQDYDLVRDWFQKRYDRTDNYFKGYLRREGSLLFYRSNFLAVPGFAKVPFTQVSFKRGERSESTMITFRIIPSLLIFSFLVLVVFWVLFFFGEFGGKYFDFVFPCFLTMFLIGSMFVKYAIELSYFKKELLNFEKKSFL